MMMSASIWRLLAAAGLLATLLPVAPARAQGSPAVVINEFLASNATGLADSDGDTSDWIELHNRSGSTVDLAGWTLIADNDTWTLPAVSIDSGGYLVVFASAKNLGVVGAELHTNFKLSADGEYLALLDSNSEPASVFDPSYPVQSTDLSYGLQADGVTYATMTPTPGTVNSTGVDGVAAPPTAEIGRGVYDTTLTERLSTSIARATIRYTTDGTAVDGESPIAADTITVAPNSSGIVTIRARTYAPNMAPSAEVSWSYIFPEALFPSSSETHAGFRDRPVMALYTSDGVNPQEDRVAARLEFVDPDTSRAGFSAPMGVNEFGESSRGFEKNNYRMFFDSEWGQREVEYPLFDGFGRGEFEPTDSFRRLELRGFSWDGMAAKAFLAHPQYSMIGHYLSDRWMKNSLLDAGTLAPHGRMVQLFLNGEYWGAYHLRERYDHHFAASYGRGDSQDYEAARLAFDRVTSVTNGDGTVVDSIRDATDYQSVRELINPESLLNSVILETMLLVSREREYRVVGPIEPDHPDGFGWITNDNDFELGRLNWASSQLSGTIYNSFAKSFRGDPEFEQHVHYFAARALCPGGPLRGEANLARLEELVAELEPLMRAEQARWGGNAYSRWQAKMSISRSQINGYDATVYNGLVANGDIDGCDLRPEVDFVDNQLSATGAEVTLTVAATDPDGDRIDFSSTSLPPGLSINSTTGVISGVPTTPGTYETRIRVGDDRGKWSYHDVAWSVTGPAAAAEPAQVRLALNEYNSVATGAGWVGTDVHFGADAANGGDWLELVVATDGLDARGYQIELWDRDRSSELLTMTHRFVFAQHPALSQLPSGAIITIAEQVADDLYLDPANGDWQLNAQAAPRVDSALLISGDLDGFDTNRHDLHVIIRDATGQLAAPMSGETDEWDSAHDNLSGAEVLALCASPVGLDPVADYLDEAASSTFGAANVCEGVAQPLAELRGVPVMAGDVDCDGTLGDHDVELVLAYLIGSADDAGPCDGSAHGPGSSSLAATAGNLDGDASVGLADAHLLARCVAAGASECEG